MFALAASVVGIDSVAAITRDAFKAPSKFSGNATLGPQVDPLDWERETEITSIVTGSLDSTPGWRAQATKSTPKTTRSAKTSPAQSPTAQSSKAQSAKAVKGPALIKPAQPSPRVVVDKNADRPAWQPPRPVDLQIAGAKESGNAPRKVVSPKRAVAKPQPAPLTARAIPSRVEPQGASNLPPLTRQQRALRDKIRRVLAHYYNRPLHTGNRGPWELMHAMLSFEVHSRVLQGGPDGEPITAVGWLCFNQPCRNRTLMYINNDGDLRVRVGPALQGHHGQLLALLAQARVKSDYPMKVDGQDLTIADLIEMEQQTCYPRTELTFKLIGLMHYLDSEATWLNDQGLEWDFRRLVREELAQPVRGAACGGTHRLSGLTLAYKKRAQRGEAVDGEYAQAKRFIRNYQNYAYRLQNPDGSFSTEWFRGPGHEEDVERRLKTTGHTLEWLLYAAEPKQLTYWRTVKATNYLANIMWANRYRDWEAGPLGHAIHALVLYDRLVFSPYDAEPEIPVAEKVGRSRR